MRKKQMVRNKWCLKTRFLVLAFLIMLATIGEGTQTERVLELRVIDKATQEPISNAELSIRIMRARSEDKTDGEGKCRIALGAEAPDYVRVEVNKEGFVPIRLTWRKGPGQPEVPDQYMLALERGTSIGGIIHDEQGKPIEGVSVYLLVPGDEKVERVAIWDHVERTNADGRWRCDIVPSKLDDIWIRLAHRDYISDEMYGKTSKPPMESLRAMTGVMVMEKRLTISGRVFDANDRPIEGASVVQGSDRFNFNYPSTQTDGRGYFEFQNIRPGEMVLTVQAKGYSPDLIQFTAYSEMEPLEFSLEPGRTIRGRIVDMADHPVAGALIMADTWRGYRSLEWHTHTDAEGRFQWNEAPVDEVFIDISKEGYMSVRQYNMSPSEQEYEITLPDILKIRGKVVDADTNEPISEFKLLSGIHYGDDRPISWRRRNPKIFTQGHYETRFTHPHPAYIIQVEADGYKPEPSRPIGSDEGEVTIDFKLAKGMGPAGIVLLPDGSPATGAEAILCTPSQGAYIQDGRQRYDGQFVETKQDGKFSFPMQMDAYAIVVLHDDGYAEVTEDELAESPEVTLQPWARVEGQLIIGKEPGAHEGMRLRFDRRVTQNGLRFYYRCNTVTDVNGNFVFERIAPGSVRIYHEIKVSEKSTHFSHGIDLEIEAGETYKITIGGTGRPVTGKILVPDYFKNKFDWRHTNYGLRIKTSEGPYSQLGFKINEDGTFRIEDVPAGDYYLHFNAYEPSAVPRSFGGETIAFLSQHFNVPTMPNGRSDEPLNLGVLELDVIGKSDYVPSLVDKPLPDLRGIAIDFTPVQAKDRMMLVCFFDMNQRPSRYAITQLAQRAKPLEDKGVTIFAVHTSRMDKTILNEWVKKNDVPFPLGWIEGDEEKTRFTWGVKSLPWLILADRKHIVQAEGFAPAELDARIQKINKKQ